MPEKVCDTCNESKDIPEFNKDGDGTYYNNCKVYFLDHWRAAQLKFWSYKIPDDVAFALKLYHCPSTQKILTEYLIRIVEPVIMKRQRENISKEEILKQRLEAPRPIIAQTQTRPRRLRVQRKNDGVYLWN